jgi:hypothetical protein
LEAAIIIHFIRVATRAGLLVMLLPSDLVSAQSQLPAPSRTIYQCKTNGTVSYSDEPCVGAQRIDASPARGISHLSGSPKVGKDVANEIQREQFATAVQPLTGMTPSQLATASRRNALAPAARRECNQLEPAILDLEQAEKRADAAAIKSIQLDLYVLRKRYRKLVC